MNSLQMFLQILEYALLGVFSQNLIFTAGIGSNRMLRMATIYKNLLPIGFYMFLFSTAGAWLAPQAIRWLHWEGYTTTHWMLLFLAGLTVLYFVVMGLVCLLFGTHSPFFQTTMQILPGCAYNCIIVSMPFIVQKSEFTPMQSVGFCFGAALGLVLAVKLVREAIRRLDDPQIPDGYKGKPGLLLYIGILSMAFIAISGQPFLFA